MTKTLYCHPMSTPVRAVQLLAKQLGVRLTLKMLALDKGEHLKPSFLAINPQHCVPTLDDEGFILYESRAILGYLVDTYAKSDTLFPKDPKKRAEVNQRLHFDIGTLSAKIGDYFKCLLANADPSEILKNINVALTHLDAFLEGSDWVACNQKTIADYSMVPAISNLEVTAFDLSKFPNILSWMKRAKADFVDYEEINEKAAIMIADYLKNMLPKKQ